MMPSAGHRLLRDAGVLLTQLLLLAAIPIILWALARDPIPHHLPTRAVIQADWNGLRTQPGEITDYLAPPLADLLWIVWAWYAAWFLFALLAGLVRLPVRILPRLTPKTAISALTASAALANPISHNTAVHAIASEPHDHRLPDAYDGRLRLATTATTTSALNPIPTRATLAPPGSNGQLVHRVMPGDNLWDLAVTYYGSGAAWRSIYAANEGTTQSDGQSLTDPDVIQPGWRLIIPTPTGANTTTATGSGTTPGPATVGTTGPDTAPPAPVPTTGPHTAPTPAASGTGPIRPTPVRAHQPHTVALTLPANAGYTGITLIAATAAAVAILRTRNRHHLRPADTDIPPLARHLTAVHAAAESAHSYGFQPDQHPGHQPPPLLRSHPGTVILGTNADQEQETDLDAALRAAGVLVLTGPGALNTARAAAVSILAATPPGADTPTRILITDAHLADQLLATTRGTERTAGWLVIAPTPEAALASYQRYARRTQPAAPRTANDTAETPPQAGDPRITLIQHADPELWDTLRETHHLDQEHQLDALLIGPPAPPGDTHITMHLSADSSPNRVTGPGADWLLGIQPHTLSRQAAAEIFHTLATARPRHPVVGASHAEPRPSPPPPDTDNAREPGSSGLVTMPQDADAPEVQLRRSLPVHSAGQNGPPESNTVTPPVRVTSVAVPGTRLTGADPTSLSRSGPILGLGTPRGEPQATENPRALANTPLFVRVLGTVDILGPDQHHTTLATEQGAALITLLTLNPEGLTSAAILEHEWPQSSSDRENRQKLASAVSRVRLPLRMALNQPKTPTSEPVLFDTRAHSYRLNPEIITTDLALARTLSADAQHTEDPDAQLSLLTQAAAVHRGELSAHLDTSHRDWLTTARYTILTERLTIHLAIAKLAAVTDPARAAEHLRTAVTLAPEDRDTLNTALQLCTRLRAPALASSLFNQHAAALRLIDEDPDSETTQLVHRITRHNA